MSQLDIVIEKCLSSEMAFCQAACPLHVDMKSAIARIAEDKFDQALQIITRSLPFPGIVGRVCTRPCENVCLRQEVDECIAINHLKRSAADYGVIDQDVTIPEEKTKRIAIIGSGPTGLMAAYELRKMGYPITIFEALPVLGGMLATAIPEWRLPRDILQKEISIIEKLGVQTKLSSRIGEDIKFSDLRRDFDTILIATGTQLNRRLPVDGSDLPGVRWGVNFLREVNLNHRAELKGTVVVVGGGNVAVDAALTASRLGAAEVQLVCLETGDTMPAFEWEVQQALAEGVILNPSCGVKRILGNTRVEGLELCRCTSVFDNTGRFNPTFDESATSTLKADNVILAIGQTPDTAFLKDSDVERSPEGLVYTNELTLETSVPGIFAGGDTVYGPKSVIEALAAGKKAAISIDRYLRGEDLTTAREKEGPQVSNLQINIAGVTQKARVNIATLPLDQRKQGFGEVELGFTKEQAIEEARRCLSCECRLCVKGCEFLKQYGESPKELAERFKAGYFREKPQIPYSCNLCSLCQTVCPQKISIGDACLELRQRLVDEKLGPLPPHKYVDWNVDWSTSDSFALALPDPNTNRCQRVFFPGCSLSGYNPSLVIKTYDYLRERLPDTGILLYCCGAPRRDLGIRSRFDAILNGAIEKMAKLGASELILPCPNCYKTFKMFAPQLKLRSLYEVMAELGLPEGITTKEHTFSIYDPCTARWEKGIQDSVRNLVRMMGYHMEEMEHSREFTRCCGTGGMVPYVDIWLAFKVNKRQGSEAHFDLLTYCATCREAFANPEASGKPIIHILDLIFNSDWEQARLNPPNIGQARRENQAKVKRLLLEGADAKAKT